MASLSHPTYIVKIKERGGKKIRDVTQNVMELSLIDEENELAYKAELKLADIVLSDKSLLSSKIYERDTVYVYVNTGGKNNLLFYGTIWEIHNVVTNTNEVKYTIYDPLIYLQKSETAIYFKKNKQTKTMVTHVICTLLGLKLSYNYRSKKHGKISHRGTYADLIVDTLFESVRKSTGVRGILRWKNGVVEAYSEGFNKEIYTIKVNETATSVEYASTMDDMITRVKIVNGKKTKATISGNTKTWGVIQQIQDKGKSKLATAKAEARQTIKDKGKPTRRWKIEASDVPYIRKGHQVRISGSIMPSQLYIVKSITHNFHSGIMEMEVSKK